MSQETPILGLANVRQRPRINVSGRVFWSSERTEGWCQLLSLSSGGVGISPQRTLLKPRKGCQYLLTLMINDLRFEGIHSETVEVAADRLCLRFVNPDESLQTRIASLVELLGSHPH